MGKTIDCITNGRKLAELHIHAMENMEEWINKGISSPKCVEVINEDWGVVTLEASKKYGKIYTVLNMASSVFPGGGALEGLSAQEENMWHRSTCPVSLLDDNVLFDEESQSFVYDSTTRDLLQGKILMSAAEQASLRSLYRSTVPAYKALIVPYPQVCFRGPEITFPDISSFLESPALNKGVSDTVRSFEFLPNESIFMFYELRSAAPELQARPNTFDSETLSLYEADIRRRISSQLDTLLLEGKYHVCLGAWGCGAFKNDANIVARIYAEEIRKRASLFEHIVFAIINTGMRDLHAVFKQDLQHIELGMCSPNHRNEIEELGTS